MWDHLKAKLDETMELNMASWLKYFRHDTDLNSKLDLMVQARKGDHSYSVEHKVVPQCLSWLSDQS